MISKQTITYAALSALCLVSNATFAKINDDIDLSGYIMLDYNKFDTSLLEGQYDSNSSESTSEIRPARLSFKSDISKDWKSKFQLGFADGETEIKDAYLEYSGWKYADVTIGQQKEGFGLEKLTSSRKLLMLERSMISEAFSPGRSLGISLSGDIASVNWQLGYYEPDEDEATSAITGRVAWVPWQ